MYSVGVKGCKPLLQSSRFKTLTFIVNDSSLMPRISLEDMVSEELAARCGKPRRLPPQKLQLPKTRATLKLLENQQDH